MSTTATPFGQMAHGTSSLFDADGGTTGLFGAKAQSGNKLFLVQSMLILSCNSVKLRERNSSIALYSCLYFISSLWSSALYWSLWTDLYDRYTIRSDGSWYKQFI